MAEFVSLIASDGHKFQAWAAAPMGKPRGGVVVIQEIFGVNSHIRDVTERYAHEGYLAIAPALFDRLHRGFEVGYAPDDIAKGRELVGRIDWDKAVLDVEAAHKAAAADGKVGIAGYCFGGSLAWLAACRLTFDAAVCYYGGQIARFAKEKPRCPVIMHFGRLDAGIPMTMVEEIRAAQPGVPIHLYDAGHGFACNQRASFDKTAYAEAWKHTTEFLARHIG